MATPRDLIEDERNMAVTDGQEVTERDLSNVKNQCTAWVKFRGDTTPPTIEDSFNISSITRLATGQFEAYFTTPMDNTNYAVASSTMNANTQQFPVINPNGTGQSFFTNKMAFRTYDLNGSAGATFRNPESCQISFYGGKN